MADDDRNSTTGGRDGAQSPRLDYLLERLCDQLATDDELAELNAIFARSKAAREYYLQTISLHSSLQRGLVTSGPEPTGCLQCASLSPAAAKGAAAARSAPSVARVRRLFRPSRRIGWSLVTAATLLVVFIGVAAWWKRAGLDGPIVSPKETADVAPAPSLPVPEGRPVARVTEVSENVAWWNPNESIALMSQVRAGDSLHLSRGEIRLTYHSGVELRLLAPADFIVHAEGGELRRGGLRAVVPEEGRGFTIETPNGKVVDLGTEFSVAVDDFGVSEVSVFQGIVDAFPSSTAGDGTQTIRLTKGEAVQWNRETFIRLKADPLRFRDGRLGFPNRIAASVDPVLDEDLTRDELDATQWRQLGDVQSVGGEVQLRGPGGSGELPCLVTSQQFAPTDGSITVVCDVRFTQIDAQLPPSFAVLTRSAGERDVDVPESRRTMHTCVRCSFKLPSGSSIGVVEAATKLDRQCGLTNILWRGFDRLEADVPYRLVMTDDGINVSFTVSLRDNPSVHKTVTCHSLFRGKENFIALEGPAAGTVAIDRIQVFHNRSASTLVGELGNQPIGRRHTSPVEHAAIQRVLDSLAPAEGNLILRDDFDTATLDPNVWTTLDDVAVVDGRVRLGGPNPEEHINTWTNRPYLITRQDFAPDDGTLTILGTVKFARNFLNEYGGSFAVMTRADNRHGNGPGWEYSILRYGVRANFWPAAWGQEHSLEIHEKPSPSTLSLLLAEGLEINPEARQYVFQVVDDGERVTMTIQDARDATIRKTVSAPTNPALRSGFVGFEACWGCPLWIDNVRVYRTPGESGK